MKITCLIDSLTAAGAQRQMALLCRNLALHGEEVTLVTYHPLNHYRELATETGATHIQVSGRSKLGRTVKALKAVQASRPDAVVAYLNTPNAIALLYKRLHPSTVVLVSERSSHQRGIGRKEGLRLKLLRFADALITNSFIEKEILEKAFPVLKGKIHPIVNCVELDQFKPVENPTPPATGAPLRLLGVGRTDPDKNPAMLARALSRAGLKGRFQATWYGARFLRNGQPTEQSHHYLNALETVEQAGIDFEFKDPIPHLLPAFHAADVVCQPTRREGCSNVICEALACGVPVITTRGVGDNDRLVEHGVTGFLFDKDDDAELEACLSAFAALSEEARREMSRRCREVALERFAVDRFVNEYLGVIKKAQAPTSS